MLARLPGACWLDQEYAAANKACKKAGASSRAGLFYRNGLGAKAKAPPRWGALAARVMASFCAIDSMRVSFVPSGPRWGEVRRRAWM